MHIGVLGGTGKAGSSLAGRLALGKHQLTIGSRDAQKAETCVKEILKQWPDLNLDISPSDNAGAAQKELVIIATASSAAIDTAAQYEKLLRDKVVISMCNFLERNPEKEFVPVLREEGSIAQAIAKCLPKSFLSAAFHHLPSEELAELQTPVDSDVLICSDGSEALTTTAELIQEIPNLRPLYAGSLKTAGPVEAFTATLINLSKRYKARAAVRFTGISSEIDLSEQPK